MVTDLTASQKSVSMFFFAHSLWCLGNRDINYGNSNSLRGQGDLIVESDTDVSLHFDGHAI